MRRGAAIAAAVIIGPATMTACTLDGTATRTSISLDTGKYLAERSLPLTAPTSDVLWAKIRGIRLAEHLVFPREVDSALVAIKWPYQPLATPDNLAGVHEAFTGMPVIDRFQYGFVLTVGDGDAPGKVGVKHAVLVFDSSASADRAVDDFADELLAQTPDQYFKDFRSEPIAGAPSGTRTVQLSDNGDPVAIGLKSVGAAVVYTWSIADDLRRAEKIVATALTKQKKLLESAPAVSDDREPDPTGLIRGTLVGDGGGDPMGRSVYGPRGYALLFDDQPAAFAVLSKTGVDAVAVDGSEAYRAASEPQAKELADYVWWNSFTGQSNVKHASSPRDLPGARCWFTDTRDGRAGCTVVVGRYVGDAQGSSLREAQQKISAISIFLADL